MGFYQVATRVPDVFLVPFPKSAQNVLSIFEVFNINIAGLSLPLSCVGLGSYLQQMLFSIIFPYAMAVCIFVCSMAYAMYTRKTSDDTRHDASKSLLKVGGLVSLPLLLKLSFLVFPSKQHCADATQ